MRDKRMKVIEHELKKLVGGDRNSDSFKTYAVLLAAVLVGPDIDELVFLTGYSREFITDISRRMHASGRWENGAVNNEYIKGNAWNDASLALDGLVAEGTFVVVGRTDDGKWLYRPAPSNSEVLPVSG